jgi:hypothetical protein
LSNTYLGPETQMQVSFESLNLMIS